MARGVNKVILIGNLGQDPEVRYMPNGNAVANITLATSESYKDKNTGQMVDKTEWHRVVFFGKLGEIVGEHCRKGSQIYIEGKLQTRKWTDQQGQEKYTTEIVVDGFTGQMQMLGSKPGEAGNNQGNNQGQQYNQGNNQGQQYSQGNNQGQQRSQGNNQGQQNNHQSNQQNNNQGPQKQATGGFAPKPTVSNNDYMRGGPGNPMEPTIDFDDDIPF